VTQRYGRHLPIGSTIYSICILQIYIFNNNYLCYIYSLPSKHICLVCLLQYSKKLYQHNLDSWVEARLFWQTKCPVFYINTKFFGDKTLTLDLLHVKQLARCSTPQQCNCCYYTSDQVYSLQREKHNKWRVCPRMQSAILYCTITQFVFRLRFWFRGEWKTEKSVVSFVLFLGLVLQKRSSDNFQTFYSRFRKKMWHASRLQPGLGECPITVSKTRLQKPRQTIRLTAKKSQKSKTR